MLVQNVTIVFRLFLALQVLALFACKKSDVSAPAPSPEPPVVDNSAPLKDAADFPVGAAVSYSSMTGDATYAGIVKRDFDAVTFDYNMKHGAVVNADGSKDYSRADELVTLIKAAGLTVFGHTLVWHQNNNGDFLRSFSTAPVPTGTDMLLSPKDLNGKLDNAGQGTTPSTLFSWWFGSVGSSGEATFERETEAASQQGASSLKVTVTKPGTNAWDVQFINQDWKPVAGATYQLRFWVKAANGGSFRAINQTPNTGSPNFSSITVTPPTAWSEVVWNYTAPANAIQFGFHFPSAGTFWIDNVSIVETTVSPVSSAVAAARMDSVMKDWIQTTVNRYKVNVHAWDVVNEPFTDGNPVLRTGATSTGDTYYWAHYLGRDYIANAFRYASEADPTAALFLNDYNLESNSAKLDSIIALATALKTAGVPITGIGTQMHISVGASYTGIDQMMQKLAATGLKIRVSELDVRVGNGGAAGTPPPATALANQAALYQHVVSSYRKYVPAAQRAGITVWGVTDNTSWLYKNGADYPLLYDKDYNRKPAYAGFLSALRER